MALFLVGTPVLGLKANSWQARLDKATFSLDLDPRSRLRLLSRALQDPALTEDVRSAVDVIRTKGLGKGHPEVIQTLWPTGTTARADLEALTALRKQVPEALEDLRETLSSQSSSASPSLPDPSSLPDPATALQSVFESVQTLATDPAKQKELREEAADLLRRTPKGLETPKYKVERVLDGPLFLGEPQPIEIRSYDEFVVARTSMKDNGSGSVNGQFTGGSSGGARGFNKLASYLFGENESKEAMAMTMPVEVTSSSGGDGAAEGSSMAFVLPQKYAESPPAPLAGSGVTIASVPARLVAAKAFAGLATDEEVGRQKAALLEAVQADAALEIVDEAQVSVLQYNSPLTLPWRRRNEVALVVTAVDDAAAEEEAAEEKEEEAVVEEAAAEEAAIVEENEAGVVSWYDSGMRL